MHGSLHLTTGSAAGTGGNEITSESDGSNHATAVVGDLAGSHERTSATEQLGSEDDDHGHELTLPAEELENEDDDHGHELTLPTEELESEEDDHGHELTLPAEELGNEDDDCGHELTLPAEELGNEDDDCGHELTLPAEETTTGDESSFNDGSSNADSEIDSSQRDIDASDSEHEDDSEAGPSNKQDSDECEGLHKHDNDPLYPGATITVKITIILILAFVTRHKLTNEVISDLLYLLNNICPKPTKCCSSLYKFKKYFDYLVTPVTFCYYCPECIVRVNYPADKICVICKKVFSSINELCYMSVTNQIRSLFTKHTFVNDILHRFTRKIYDGSVYQQHSRSGGILSAWNNLSLTWNLDGVPVFRSSKFSLWPLYLMVNECHII